MGDGGSGVGMADVRSGRTKLLIFARCLLLPPLASFRGFKSRTLAVFFGVGMARFQIRVFQPN
jgi:hypothetical protein